MTKDEKYDTEIADPLHKSIRTVVVEYIICAANWIHDGKTHQHQPRNVNKGFVICGRRHHNCFTTAAILKPKKRLLNVEQGFLTSKDKWVDRVEAAKIAFSAGQIKRETKQLFSEDIF